MTLLTWKHDYAVGVLAMDDQHSILMDTLNELRLALVRGRGREQVAEVFDRLIEFTRMHFWSEEQLLAQEQYPLLEEHRAAHHKVLADLLQKARLMQYGEGGRTHEMLEYLRDSYLDHIEGHDIDYGLYLNERGIL
jgi:hemerythrin-like metal-binding protein